MNAGELRAVIGPNGAGKTTFFNLLSGITLPSEGTIRYKGREITRAGGTQRVRLGIAKAFQTANVYPQQTVEQNVRLAALARVQGSFALHLIRGSAHLPKVAEIAAAALDRVDLGAVATRARGRPFARRQEAARHRDRTGYPTRHPAARRAGGRDVDRRVAAHRTPHQETRRADDRADHRTRHGDDHGHLRLDHRAAPGPRARAGHAGRDPRQSEGARSLPGRPQRKRRFPNDRRTGRSPARRREDQHLLRRQSHPARRLATHRCRRNRGPLGPQRRRQDDDAQIDRRLGSAAQRQRQARRRGTRRRRHDDDRPPRRLAGARRTAHLHQPHGGRQPSARDGDGAQTRLVARPSVRQVSALARAPQTQGRRDLRRRETDAGDRPRARARYPRACCSTSRPKDSPRSSCAKSKRSSAKSKPPA